MQAMQYGYMHLMRGARTAGALAAICVATACSSTSAATVPADHASNGMAASGRVTSSPRGGPAAGGAPTRTAPAAGAVAASEPAPRASLARVRTSDGSIVTVATFRGPVRYVLHNGSADPGPAAAGLVRAGPVVTGGERARLLAAFNGGFKLSAGAGGYEQEGHVIRPLLSGLASLVIDRSGRARIGIWGHGLPVPGEAVYSVRQNLQPLVEHGRPTQAAADWGLWGATLGGGDYVARSALGQDASGDLMFAASMSATPADLAQALARTGARIAMELDINPEWVQLDVARRPGGPLTAPVPGQDRPADQYLVGWARDFITVLGPPAGPQLTGPANTARLRP
jgi:Phosphodiester glycosidase